MSDDEIAVSDRGDTSLNGVGAAQLAIARDTRLVMRAFLAVAVLLMLTACTAGAGSPARHSASASTATFSKSASEPATSAVAPPATRYLDWPTYHGDLARSGYSAAMPAVTRPLRVLAIRRLDGAVYASPIVAAGVVVIATEADTVYGFDRAGTQLWRTNLGIPARSSDLPCGNIDPSGITGTPTYDAATGSVFAVAEHAGPVRHELVALDVTTGAVRWRRSVDLPGAAPNAMQQRGALTVTGGRVWVSFGGRAGDCGDYKGRLIGSPLDGQGTLVSYTVPTSREAGIWTPPGPAVDAAGRLYVAVGNGAAGAGDPYDHSDSVLELDAGARLVDSFSPTTWASDNAADLDLGSQGPALVGDWVFAAGKSGTAYVLRRGALGGIGGQVSSMSLCRSFGGTAVVGALVYVPCNDGLRAVRINAAGVIVPLWRAAASITGSPVVGGGRVWSLDPGAGLLHALDPATGQSLAQVDVGVTSRFATPAISGDELLVPTMTGLVIVGS